MIFALLALVALSLAAVGLIRSVDSGSLVLGNVGFKQDATATAEQGTKAALTWINGNLASLQTDGASGSGYYATSHDALDVDGQNSSGTRFLVDWDNDGCEYAAGSNISGACTLQPGGAGDVQYVIFRLCLNTGDTGAAGQSCLQPSSTTATTGAADSGKIDAATSERPPTGKATYYRIVVRAKGARNTVSYTETLIHL